MARQWFHFDVEPGPEWRWVRDGNIFDSVEHTFMRLYEAPEVPPRPQKTPFRPGRRRVRLRVGGSPPTPRSYVAAAQERNWWKPRLAKLGLVPA